MDVVVHLAYDRKAGIELNCGRREARVHRRYGGGSFPPDLRELILCPA